MLLLLIIRYDKCSLELLKFDVFYNFSMFSFSILFFVFSLILKRVLTGQPGQVNAKWADCVTVGMCHNRSHCNDHVELFCSLITIRNYYAF